VLLHGTFVDTVSTFGKLWALHPQRGARAVPHYGDRVFALDHPTLGASPIANALTLVQALPDGARLHLATHSRGGLVAEVLARVCGQRGTLDAAALAPSPGAKYAGQRSELRAGGAVKARDIRVERVVRVACPARGTLLASSGSTPTCRC
jgi:pimeloyl-ACP methyl ester carboxylesterase